MSAKSAFTATIDHFATLRGTAATRHNRASGRGIAPGAFFVGER